MKGRRAGRRGTLPHQCCLPSPSPPPGSSPPHQSSHLPQRRLHLMSTTLLGVLRNFHDEYMRNTPKRLKMVDAYLSYILMTGVLQFVYCCLVGTFPFNSFLSGFICTVGCFVLGVSLRLQANPQNKLQFVGVSPERGFADFIFAHIILHLVTMNFIG